MAVIYIGTTSSNTVAMPDPKLGGFQVDLQDIDSGNTTRTANGTMVRDRVCGGANAKRKLELEWGPLSGTDVKKILQAIGGVFFYVKYPDPYTDAQRTAQFYCGDRTAPVYSANSNGAVTLWEGLKVNFIEK